MLTSRRFIFSFFVIILSQTFLPLSQAQEQEELACTEGKFAGKNRDDAKTQCATGKNKRFSYNSGACECYDIDTCSYQTKIFHKDKTDNSEKLFTDEDSDQFLLDQSFQYENPLDGIDAMTHGSQPAQNAEVEKKVTALMCAELKNKMDPVTRSALIKENCADLIEQAKASGKDVRTVDLVMDLDGVGCGTTLSYVSTKIEIPNLSDLYPNNVISIDVSKFGACAADGTAPVLDRSVMEFLGKNSIDCADLKNIKSAYTSLSKVVTDTFSTSLNQKIDAEVAKGKPERAAIEAILTSIQIPVSVHAFASALVTGTRHSNVELAQKRGQEAVSLFKKLIDQALTQTLARRNVRDIQINLNDKIKINEVATRYGSLGPVGYDSNVDNINQALKELSALTPEMAQCQSDRTGEDYKRDIFICSLYQHLSRSCLTLNSQGFPECSGVNIRAFMTPQNGKRVWMTLPEFKIAMEKVLELKRQGGLESDQALNALYAVTVAEKSKIKKEDLAKNEAFNLMIAFSKHDKSAFDRYRHFAVDSDLIYTTEVATEVKKETATVFCKIPAPKDIIEQIKADTNVKLSNYITEHDRESIFTYIPSHQKNTYHANADIERYIVEPHGFFKTLFNRECLDAKKKRKQIYKNTFGDKGWKQAMKNDRTRFQNLGGNDAERLKKFEELDGTTIDYNHEQNLKKISYSHEVSMKEDNKVIQLRSEIEKTYETQDALKTIGKLENDLDMLKSEKENMDHIFPMLVGNTEDVTIIIDTSGSMSGQTAVETEAQTKRLINNLNRYKGEHQRLNIILTDSKSTPLKKSAEDATPEFKDKAKSFVVAQQFGSGDSALAAPIAHFLKDPNTNTAYILTDAELFDYDDIRALLPAVAASKKKINTVKLGNSFLTGISQSDVKALDLSRIRGEFAAQKLKRIYKFLVKKTADLKVERDDLKAKQKAGTAGPDADKNLARLDIVIEKFSLLANETLEKQKLAETLTYEQSFKPVRQARNAAVESPEVAAMRNAPLTDAETFDALPALTHGESKTIPYFYTIDERTKEMDEKIKQVTQALETIRAQTDPKILQSVDGLKKELEEAERLQNEKWKKLRKEQLGF